MSRRRAGAAPSAGRAAGQPLHVTYVTDGLDGRHGGTVADRRACAALRLAAGSGDARFPVTTSSGAYLMSRRERSLGPVEFLKQKARVGDLEMAYVDQGAGDPVVFLHGNPTSSFIWRNILPYLIDDARCIAPDLIGMGDSDKLGSSGPDSYRFVEHRRYLDELLDTIGVHENVTVVGQDWGSALAFDWANRHQDAVKGVVHMEAVVRPWSKAEWSLPPEQLDAFLAMRSPVAEQLVLDQNGFLEHLLVDGATVEQLPEDVMAEYRRPFLEPGEGRRPTLTWPREIPFEGEPADVYDIVSSYATWLSTSPVPKLFVDVVPGFLLDDGARDFCRTWPNQTEIAVRGRHFVQEEAPDEIGAALAKWYRELG